MLANPDEGQRKVEFDDLSSADPEVILKRSPLAAPCPVNRGRKLGVAGANSVPRYRCAVPQDLSMMSRDIPRDIIGSGVEAYSRLVETTKPQVALSVVAVCARDGGAS